MRTEVIRLDGNLRREVWTFSLDMSYDLSCIYFDAYSFETRDSTRHRKWKQQYHWARLDYRNNNIADPPLPTNVIDEMRSHFQEFVRTLPIKYGDNK